MFENFQARCRALLDDLRKSQFSSGTARYMKLQELEALIKKEISEVRGR